MSYGKAGIRKDSWNHQQDVILAETILIQQAAGIGVMEAAAIAAPLVGRGQYACYKRWNDELKYKHWGDPTKDGQPEGGTDTMEENAKQAAGSANGGPIECMDAIEAATSNLNGSEAYSTGQVIRLIWNWKGGGAVALKEARWYLDRLITKVEGEENGIHSL